MCYAIDANGVCFMDNAHGHALERVKPNELLGTVDDESVRRSLQASLGLPVERPAWVVTALAHGWTPPPGWEDPK
jgi:hypothetical protein